MGYGFEGVALEFIFRNMKPAERVLGPGWVGYAAGNSRPIPMFRGKFSQNRYPYLGIFPKKGTISCDFATKTHQIWKIVKIGPIVRDFFMKMGLMFRDFFRKKKLRYIPVCPNMLGWGQYGFAGVVRPRE